MKKHPFDDKYNPENYQPEVYDFFGDFSDNEISKLFAAKDRQGTEEALALTSFTVNNKYSFKKRRKQHSALDGETIAQKRQLDCYGYTIATSQLLDCLGINHKIAFANTHSFIVANGPDRNAYFIVDSFLPKITGELNPDNICHQDCLDNNVFSLNMFKHAQEAYNIPNLNYFVRENSWIRFSKNANKYGSSDREDIKSNKNPCLIVRTYNQDEGVKTLYSFDNFKTATENNQLSTAYNMSKILRDYYPEIDIRNRPLTAEQLIRKLGNLGLNTLAQGVIDNISDGLQQTNTISPILWKASQYSSLGKIIGLDLSATAIEMLENLQDHNTLSASQAQIIKGKINKLHRKKIK